MEDKPDAAFAGVPGLQQPPSFDFNDPNLRTATDVSAGSMTSRAERLLIGPVDRRHAPEKSAAGRRGK
ncbi:hypothetical protein MTO96_006743 [Rhipicephalus appendiculatus]